MVFSYTPSLAVAAHPERSVSRDVPVKKWEDCADRPRTHRVCHKPRDANTPQAHDRTKPLPL
jgi:hypothetical protein